MKRLGNVITLWGILLLCSEIYKQIVLFKAYGSYVFWYFPWQLCSLPMYLASALLFLKNESARDTVFAFLSSFGLLGGIAVFFDPSGLHYFRADLTALSYLWHISMIVFGLLSYLCVRNKNTGFRNACILYLCCCAAALLLNLLLNSRGEINLFYISPLQPMPQIFFRDLVPVLGNHTVIALYILLTVAGAYLLFGAIGWLENKIHDHKI
ncbi:MAG: YwaF family protein [Erysipelotrichaceae bacterium]|nr:YwaF family protein [Erysipelotrichaceae bacterium]